MKIALVGYGKMGKMVELSALERGHKVVARFDSSIWDENMIQSADVCIEFSQPEAVLENIKQAAKYKKNIVVGTTGWYDQLEGAALIAQNANIGVLYGPNFSVGVNLMLAILAQASKLIDHFDEYDAAGIEAHHNQKKDSPSGTALQIARVVEHGMSRLESLPFSSVRCGFIPGTHTVMFDSPCDTISITHTARNREGFARGAVQAAEWLEGRKGFYTFDECMQSIIQRRP